MIARLGSIDLGVGSLRKIHLARVLSIMLLAAASLCLAATYCEADSPNAKLKRAADDAYASILETLASAPSTNCFVGSDLPPQCNFWQVGNIFGAGIDYVAMKPAKAKPFAQAVLGAYDHTANTPIACWYDDFGWWAVATQRAMTMRGLWSKSQFRRFREISGETWARMQPGLAVYDLDREAFDPDGTELGPKFPGGIWNYFWTFDKHPDVCNTPCNPNDSNLCGRQNSVTNGLYLLAAALRSRGRDADPYFRESAQRERNFLFDWFDPANFTNPSIQPLLFNLGSEASSPAVVRERVSIYGADHFDPDYIADLVWSGDQGLVLGGLVTLMKAAPTDPDYAQMLATSERILDGILIYLVGSDGHFYPWSSVRNPTPTTMLGPPGGDSGDYNLGISVLMRNLVEAYQTNHQLRRHMQAEGYPALVRTFAEDAAACENLLCYDGSSQLDCEGPPKCNDLIRNTNKLAVMTAALQLK
jgi:hypothetical protein